MTPREKARIALIIGKIDAVNSKDAHQYPGQCQEALWEIADELREVIGATSDQ